ncbi:sodium/hydrogen exchanger 9B2-like isoform X1 [Rhodnius prolixus]|uniref:sodium/hydrogen exchanger 9B2-like isoform X1 n=1 Tax=Rhodnius prolixus TaxID=13249 RepID=UPI003D188833
MASSQDGNSNCVEDITTNKTPSPEKDESPGYKSNKINCETAVNISTNSPSKQNSPQKTVSIVEVPKKEPDDKNCDKSNCSRVASLLSSQCGLGNSWQITIIGSSLILVLLWALLYTLLKVEVTPGGDLFKLIVLILVAYCAGKVVALAKLPPLLGMLIAGIILRTIGFFKISGVYLDIVIKLREIALTVILIKAGLGLDAPALLKLSLVVLRLALFPCLAEAVAAAVLSHYLFDYPYLWGLLLGFMLSAVSPAVVVPTLLSLKERGYGENKGISTLVIAASSLDDIVAISIFGVFLGMIFSTGDLTHQLLQGPLEMVIGLSFGITWGLIASFIPHRDDKYVVAKRSVMIGAGGLCAVLGSELIHYSGAGPLACIVASFIACLSWKLQGWSNTHNPVSDVFAKIWLILQPMLFGLIGAEIDLTRLQFDTVGLGLIVIIGALVVRVATCCLVILGGNLNWKEIIFVNLAWLPKATVQAALGPEALDLVRQQENPDENDKVRGAQLLTLAVISILLTAPIGSIGISISGPTLLSNEPVQPAKENATVIVTDTAMHMSEGSEQNGKEFDVGTRV